MARPTRSRLALLEGGARTVPPPYRQFGLVGEGADKTSRLQLGKNFQSDAAGNVDSAERQNPQSHISRFRSVGFSPDLQCFNTRGARSCQRSLSDFCRGISSAIVKKWVVYSRENDLMNGTEATP